MKPKQYMVEYRNREQERVTMRLDAYSLRSAKDLANHVGKDISCVLIDVREVPDGNESNFS